MSEFLELAAVVVPGIAAAVTAWMAIVTRRTADVAQAALDLDRSPILGVRDIRYEAGAHKARKSARPTLQALQLGVELFNAGRVPVRYRMLACGVTFERQQLESGEFLSVTGRVLPGSSTFFWLPTLPLDPNIQKYPATGRLRVEYEFGPEDWSSKQMLAEEFEVVLVAFPDHFNMRWFTVDPSISKRAAAAPPMIMNRASSAVSRSSPQLPASGE